jgi:hypothetical protein
MNVIFVELLFLEITAKQMLKIIYDEMKKEDKVLDI